MAMQIDRLGEQAMPRSSLTPDTCCGLLQAPAPPLGLVDRSTRPASSTARQKAVEGQASPAKAWPLSIVVAVQAAAPPVGLAVVTTRPALSVATQSVELGQAKSVIAVEPSTLTAALQAPAPPNGLAAVRMLPLMSAKTQSDADEQLTARNERPASRVLTTQAAAPPVGALDVSTSPELVTAEQAVSLGHTRSVMAAVDTAIGGVQ
jgi:hypothetical protein